MITGEVTAACEPVIRLRLRGPTGLELDLLAVVDTGFTEFCTLSASQIRGLDLPFQNAMPMELADGSEVTFGVYECRLAWERAERVIPVPRPRAVRWWGWRSFTAAG